MMMCWEEEPDARPTFVDLRNRLKKMDKQNKVSLSAKKIRLNILKCLDEFNSFILKSSNIIDRRNLNTKFLLYP